MVRPMADIGLFLADMAASPFGRPAPSPMAPRQRRVPPPGARAVAQAGPLASRDIPDSSEVAGSRRAGPTTATSPRCSRSSSSRGEVAVAGRRAGSVCGTWPSGSTRPTSRSSPPTKPGVIRDERLLRSLGVARPKYVGDAGVPAEVEGTTGLWRVDPEATAAGFEGRTAVLSPFDRSSTTGSARSSCSTSSTRWRCTSRRSKRRWGYFALPVLHDDRLVGKVDDDRRPEDVAAPRACRSRRREVHPGHDCGGQRRTEGSGDVARARRRPLPLTRSVERVGCYCKQNSLPSGSCMT